MCYSDFSSVRKRIFYFLAGKRFQKLQVVCYRAKKKKKKLHTNGLLGTKGNQKSAETEKFQTNHCRDLSSVQQQIELVREILSGVPS